MEIWKDIKGYEGLYQISNLGNVRSLDRYVNHSKNKNCKVLRKGKILKKTKDNKGYYFFIASKSSNTKTIYIHKSVCENFKQNKDNKPCVNHINGIKTDNNVNNLEYCTYKENIQHAFKTRLNKGRKRKVLQYDLEGNFIREWESMTLAAQKNKICITSIYYCCNGKRKVVNEFIWKYKN